MHEDKKKQDENYHDIALVYLEEIDNNYQVELVKAIIRNEGYEIVSPPFFAKHLALGDMVSVENEDGIHYFESILNKSGRSIIRVLFYKKNKIHACIDKMSNFGASIFRYKESILYAFDIPSDADYSSIVDYLNEGTQKGYWEYEEACLGWK